MALVLPSVLTSPWTVCAAENMFRTIFLGIRWRQGTNVACASQTVDIFQPLAAHIRPIVCLSGFSNRQFPGFGLHETGLGRQIGSGTLVSGKEKSSLCGTDKLLIKCK